MSILETEILEQSLELASRKVSLAEYLAKQYGGLPKAKHEWINWLRKCRKELRLRLKAVDSTLKDLEV